MPFLADRIFGWKPVTIDEDWGLQTIKAGTAYAICNTLQCSDCDFVFLDIRFSDAELANLYKDYRGDQYNDLREFYEPGYTERNRLLNAGIHYIPVIEKFLEPYVEFPLRILDWGGDTGKNTPFMSRSTSCDIFDISEKPVIPGAQRVEKSDVYTREYDLVVCSNVLEHIPYPSDLICDMRRAMSNDSILYIEVPYENIMQSVSGGGDLQAQTALARTHQFLLRKVFDQSHQELRPRDYCHAFDRWNSRRKFVRHISVGMQALQ